MKTSGVIDMLLISPIDSVSEAEALLEGGADELYGGYVPADWAELFGLLSSINQRTFAGAQIDGHDDLVEIVQQAHRRRKRFLLTLNAPFYTEQQWGLVESYLAETVAAGIDGIILADLGLARHIRKTWPDLELHASTLAHLTNRRAVMIYAEQGFKRVIIPRHLSLADMQSMAQASTDVRFDAFLLIGKCPNTEGHCSFHHSSPDKIWPCEIPYRLAPLRDKASEALQDTMQRQASWSRSNRRHGCGLCAIPLLRNIGVHGLKIVGRGAPTHQKLANLSLARQCLDFAAQGMPPDVFRRETRSAYRRRFGHPCSTNVCYYPELHPDRSDS